MGSGNKSADIQAELARWAAYQRERAYFESQASAELRRAVKAWESAGGRRRMPDERDAALRALSEMYPESVRLTVTLSQLSELVTGKRRRGRPVRYDVAAWPAVRSAAVARIRRRKAGQNFPSRKRIADELGIGERTVYNYDRAYRRAAGE